MDVDINEVVSTVRAVDGRELLSDKVLRQIIEAVTKAVDDKLAHEKRAEAERKVTGGVSAERDMER